MKRSLNTWLFGILFVEIVLLGLFSEGNGDTGAYTSFVYQYVNGALPYVDFWYQQGIAYPIIVGMFVRFLGPSLLSQRIVFIFFSLIVALLSWLVLRISTNKKGIAAQFTPILFGVGILSFDFWVVMVKEGTKSSLVVSLLMAGLLCLYLYSTRKNVLLLLISALLIGLLLGTKHTFLSTLVVSNIFLFVYSNKRLRDFALFNGIVCTTLFSLYSEIILNGKLSLLFENFLATRQEYLIKSAETPIKFGIIRLFEFFNYEVLKYLILLPFVAVIIQRSIRTKATSRHPLVLLFLWTAFAHVFSHIIALFPSIYTWHYDIVYPLVVLAVLVTYLNHGDEKRLLPLPGRQAFGVSLIYLVVNFGLAIQAGDIGYGRLAPYGPSQFVYEVLGKNEVVNKLNELADRGTKEYLYIGRANHHVITTRLREVPISASGTVPTETLVPDRTLANRLNMVAVSNFEDLVKRYDVLVVQRQRLEMIHELDNFDKLATKMHHLKIFTDSNYDIYSRVRL